MSRVLTGFGLLFALSLSAKAADWPQFLGPNRDGTSPETVSPWTGTLKPAWSKAVGDAHSSPVVAGNTVYAFYQPKGKNADALAAFDAQTGELKWEKSYDRPEFKPLFGAGPRSTPAISKGKVFTLGGTGILACWDAKTGDILWQVDTLKEFKAPNLFFGISTSPLVDGDRVIVMVGGKGAGIVAFSVVDGKPVWQATDDPSSYASGVRSGDQLIFLTGSHLRALSLDGKLVWGVPFTALVGPKQLIESSTTPLKVGDLVIGSSVTDGSIALRVTTDGGKVMTEQAWKNPKLTCYFSTPVSAGKHLYMLNGAATLTNPSITLRCVETSTGKVVWEKEKVGRYHAALIRTADNQLLMLDDNGYLTLFDADPAGYKERARSKVCGPTWAHPALVDGKLYLRDDRSLICIPLGK